MKRNASGPYKVLNLLFGIDLTWSNSYKVCSRAPSTGFHLTVLIRLLCSSFSPWVLLLLMRYCLVIAIKQLRFYVCRVNHTYFHAKAVALDGLHWLTRGQRISGSLMAGSGRGVTLRPAGVIIE